MKNLNQKRVLITGSGQGLGLIMAQILASEGAEIIIADIDQQRIDKAVEQIRVGRHQAFGYQMDVTDPKSVQRARNQIHAERGPIDILINNAGVVKGGLFLDVPLEDHQMTFQVNTWGPVNVTHCFLPDLISRPEGQLVNIASAAGLIALPWGTTYASSKWASLGFSESIREELRLTGADHVKVTSVCPSYIQTGMFSGVKAPLFLPVLKPNKVARMVLKAIKREKEMVMAPWLVSLLPLGKGTMHRAVFRKMCEWLGVTYSMKSWLGHGPDCAKDTPRTFKLHSNDYETLSAQKDASLPIESTVHVSEA